MMTRVVFKYPIELQDEVVVDMPTDARIIHLAVQDGTICAWAIVDPDGYSSKRTFFVRGTGHPMPERPCVPVGSVFFNDGALVFHVFEAAT